MDTTRDELLAAALKTADPESEAWSEAVFAVVRQHPLKDNTRWALSRITDPDVLVRRFAAEVLHFSTVDGDGPDEPYAAEAQDALLARILVEPDAETMSELIPAYTGFRQHGVVPELLPFARDPRPEVRCRVGNGELLNGASEVPPEPRCRPWPTTRTRMYGGCPGRFWRSWSAGKAHERDARAASPRTRRGCRGAVLFDARTSNDLGR